MNFPPPKLLRPTYIFPTHVGLKYLEDPNVKLTPDFDLLAWWKANGSTYPILQLIARDILTIPVSSVPLECAFSTGGRVLSPHRSRLLPSTVEALMCAQNWIWTNIKDGGELVEMKYSQLAEEMEEQENESGVTYFD